MTKVNLYLPAALWRAFRVACLEHGISASKLIAQLIEAQLQSWATGGAQ